MTPGEQSVELAVPGGSLVVVYGLVTHEAERRQEVELGHIERRELLEALSTLPHEIDIDWNDIDLHTQVELDTATVGCVESSPTTVRRVVEPVVEPRRVVASYDGSRSVREISLFAAMAPRVLVGDRLPPEPRLSEMVELGIGFALTGRAGTRVVLEAASTTVRPGPRRWYVQELIWRQVQESAEVHALR